MSHYVAELIEAAKEASGGSRAAAQEACAKAILDLWEYRATFPDRLRPFKELDPVLKVLASLDVKRPGYRYHQAALHEAATAQADEDTKRWLDLAIGIDFAARLFIATALRSAAERAASTTAPWVELAAQAGAEEGAERALVDFVLSEEGEGDEAPDTGAAQLREQLAKLESFTKLAGAFASDIRKELDAREADSK
ncbi:hypothetical protein [Corallococcus sp. AB038B]|uniref:hypothetical protein n=1 Tax=Corallococcus sp. AB038B TaxID=2316718 RepID=UPI0011C448DC|nr:hypothetical protein [Corallococcus sp. AB038B]